MSKDEITETQTLVFDIFGTLKWLERIWKVFCFRFEYKYYRENTNKYMITWEEFEGIFLDEFKVDPDQEGININEFIIYHTFKKIFEYSNYEIRVYRVYMFFFPYCLHLNGAEGGNFIDLLFEKIIYNLEVEIRAALNEQEKKEGIDKALNEDEGEEDIYNLTNYNNKIDKRSKKSKSNKNLNVFGFSNYQESSGGSKGKGIIFNQLKKNYQQSEDTKKNANFNSNNKNNNNQNSNYANSKADILAESARPIINKADNVSKRNKNVSPFNDQNISNMQIEADLLRKYHDDFLRRKQSGFVRLVSFEVFKEIMLVYFQNNIFLFIKAFKDVLTDFKDYVYVDDNLVDKIKAIEKDKIELKSFTIKNIEDFLNNSYEKKLFGLRNNIKRSTNEREIFLTFDDIYVYMKNNYYFYNCKELYYEFKNHSIL